MQSVEKDEGKSTADEFEKHVSASVSLLRLTAGALVSGVAQVYLLYAMASWHVKPVLQGNVEYFGQGLATGAGVIYTGMLAAIFLPLLSGQKMAGRELLQKFGRRIYAGNMTYLSQLTGDDSSKLPVLKAALTVLAPLLAGFLTKLASYLTENIL